MPSSTFKSDGDVNYQAKNNKPHNSNGEPPPEVTLEKPQRETMIVSSSYQGVNANIANRAGGCNARLGTRKPEFSSGSACPSLPV